MTEPAHSFEPLPEIEQGWQWVDGHPFPGSLSEIEEVPPPRHAWGDVIICPDCGRAWIFKRN